MYAAGRGEKAADFMLGANAPAPATAVEGVPA